MKYFVLLPTLGIAIFIVLYFWAASVYLSGSTPNDVSEGFSIIHNYWCNLFSEGKNGNYNPSRPIALTAMFILCLSLSIFWYYLPRLFTLKTTPKTSFLNIHIHQWITYLGILGMSILLFLSTSYHDTAVNIGGLFANLALILSFIELWRNQLYKLLGFGSVLFLLALINFTIYQTGYGIIALPLVQKLSFAYGLWWLAWVNIRMYKTMTLSD